MKKLKLWDYHVHTQLCNHARGNVEDYVKQAIKIDLGEIGVSDHFPMLLLPEESHDFAMGINEFPEYLDECKRAKNKYKDEITVKIASEVDFSPSSFSGYRKLVSPYLETLDYIIGSIHIIKIPETETFAIDGPIANEKFNLFGEDRIFIAYYNDLIRMVKNGSDFYNIVGHLDLPKKYGNFLGESEKIWKKIDVLLDLIKVKELVVEINHSGYYKPVGIQYPDDKIIRELVKREIPIVLGSDSHYPKYLAFNFEKTLSKLKRMQFEEKTQVNLCKFSKREKTLIKLDSVI
ncbi:histidinol-phosphatase HisJ [Promethearchaeum syntrophicum]|uniref:histidinol-phosphatase n=1 Tax=Promethearchaeum syntrophicum TaxID=2594042 RepID=A0A5B9D913_9ARCH|nr:histidinol-phosphatase HisJ [Candidatus Prometheoarchaeum syntrophicum]QEE15511.1 histidinol-phosphatase [Candidatus Prometheoarchaeum syntrophicum]